MHSFIEAKSLLSSPGKMIGEQYKIIGIAQAETKSENVRPKGHLDKGRNTAFKKLA